MSTLPGQVIIFFFSLYMVHNAFSFQNIGDYSWIKLYLILIKAFFAREPGHNTLFIWLLIFLFFRDQILFSQNHFRLQIKQNLIMAAMKISICFYSIHCIHVYILDIISHTSAQNNTLHIELFIFCIHLLYMYYVQLNLFS